MYCVLCQKITTAMLMLPNPKYLRLNYFQNRRRERKTYTCVNVYISLALKLEIGLGPLPLKENLNNKNEAFAKQVDSATQYPVYTLKLTLCPHWLARRQVLRGNYEWEVLCINLIKDECHLTTKTCKRSPIHPKLDCFSHVFHNVFYQPTPIKFKYEVLKCYQQIKT